MCSLPFLGYCLLHNITGRGPGHTVIHTKQVINGLNLPAEPGQGVEMGKRVRKTHSKVKKSNYEVLSLLIPHLRIKCRHGEPVSHTNAMLALSTMFTVIKMFGLLPMFAKMFNTLCKRTPLPRPQSFHCLNPNVVFSPQKGNPG